MRKRITLPISIIVMLLAASLSAVVAGAYHEDDETIHPFADPAFERTWQRTDEPVASGEVARTWMWGPSPYTEGMEEPYAESIGGMRQVQYFDKARMEINDADSDNRELWFVTNGRLVVEMMDGQLQVGDNEFIDHSEGPSNENVAGDPGENNGPTYATMGMVRDAPPAEDGAVITERLSLDGTIEDDPAMAEMDVTAAFLVTEWEANHQVASVFWDFMHLTDTVFVDGEYVTDQMFESPFYMTGYPVTEPYWTEVRVDGNLTDVLIQCFERRCLTYTPANEEGWQVEAGNVGQHYFRWRQTHVDDAGSGDGGDVIEEPSSFTATIEAVGEFTAAGTVTLTVADGLVETDGTVTELDAETAYEVRIVATADCATVEDAEFVSFEAQSDEFGELIAVGSIDETLLTSELSSSVVVIYNVDADAVVGCGAIVADDTTGDEPIVEPEV